MKRFPLIRLFAAFGLFLNLTAPARPQVGIFNDARALVSRTQEDLRRADGLLQPSRRHKERYDKEKERFDNALRHLSEFDRELTRRRFDKGKLDAAIDDVKNVVEHNTLSPESRDALMADLRSLRELRANRGRM
jgi:hypothetical protein